MAGIITVLPPLIEQPPGNNSSNPAGLPGVTYTFALLGLGQTWTAKQIFPQGNISLFASDIMGTLPPSTLPLPTASTLGGVESIAAAPHNWINSISTSGVPSLSQPSFSDVSGTLATAQLPSLASMTALRALAPPSTPVAVYLSGYYAAADLGAGVFIWNGTSSSADDGGSIIQPNAGGTGRWIRHSPSYLRFSPGMFGGRANGTNDQAFVQAAMDALYALGGGTLWFDTIYTVSGLHANGFSVIDWKTGVNIDGPGGVLLSTNTNVASSVFTASFSTTTMTVSAISSGTIVANQFITGATPLQPATQIVTQLGGTPGGIGTYQTTTSNTLGSMAVKGINRMVEMLGNYSTSPVVGVSDTACKNILFDYNGANNCASQTIWSFNAVVTVQTGTNIVFDGVRFRNNCGSNTIVLGKLQATPSVTHTDILNCSFENDGDRINSASVDYSTIFAVVNGLLVTGNKLALGPSINGAAFEVYGPNIDISGNRISGYYNTANIVAIAGQTTKNVDFIGNDIQDCSVGVTLWANTTTSRLYGINISGNTWDANVGSPGGPYMVDGVSQVNASADLRNILIEGNVFQNLVLTDTTRTSNGISLKSFFSAKISNNLLWGIPGIGIYLTNAVAPASVEITNNMLVNTGYAFTLGAAQRSGITLDASTTVGTVVVRGNTVNPLNGYTLTTGVNNALAATVGYISDNIVTGATTGVTNTGSGVISYAPALPGVATPLIPSGAGAVGTSALYARQDHVHPAANTNTPLLFSAGSLATLTAAGTYFLGTSTVAATENVVAIPMPAAGVLKNMYVSTNSGPGGATTYIATVSKNGSVAGSPPSVTLTGASTTGNDTARSLTVVAGDLISVKLVTLTGAATANGFNAGLELVTTSP